MIKAENLVKDYGPIRAVDRISFSVNKGDILGFLGPNGAGKSTTMKIITGFLPPTSGRASIGGHDVRENPIKAKKLTGYLPENGPLYNEMTVMEFLHFVAEMRGYTSAADKRQKIGRVLDICHLHQVRRQPIDTLSKGFRQRVGMAQAVLHDPPCLVMDEPTDGLDPNQKREVRQLIASMAREKAIVLSTHILEEVEAVCNRVIIVDRGKILVDEKPREFLRRHPRYNAVMVTLQSGEKADIKKALQELAVVGRVEERNGGLLAVPKNKEPLKEELWQLARDRQWPVRSIEEVPVRMEEVFWELTSGKES